MPSQKLAMGWAVLTHSGKDWHNVATKPLTLSMATALATSIHKRHPEVRVVSHRSLA